VSNLDLLLLYTLCIAVYLSLHLILNKYPGKRGKKQFMILDTISRNNTEYLTFLACYIGLTFNFITLLGILTITISRYHPKGNVRMGQKKPMRGTSLLNFTKKLHYTINYSYGKARFAHTHKRSPKYVNYADFGKFVRKIKLTCFEECNT
jgi:hypothetical protein